MTCPGTANSELVDGYIVALSRGSQLRVRLADGREIRAIPELEALAAAECPGAPIGNRPVQVRMYKHGHSAFGSAWHSARLALQVVSCLTHACRPPRLSSRAARQPEAAPRRKAK